MKKTLDFCYGHRLLDYQGPCQHLHGHNARVEVKLIADRLDRQGMVADFLLIKQEIQAWLDAHLDHKLLLRKDDPLIPVLTAQRELFVATEENPTAEHLARMIWDAVNGMKLPVISVTVWENDRSAATFTAERKIR